MFCLLKIAHNQKDSSTGLWKSGSSAQSKIAELFPVRPANLVFHCPYFGGGFRPIVTTIWTLEIEIKILNVTNRAMVQNLSGEKIIFKKASLSDHSSLLLIKL
jgi:hypothetical protein